MIFLTPESLWLGRKLAAGHVPVGYTPEQIRMATAALEHERWCEDHNNCPCWM